MEHVARQFPDARLFIAGAGPLEKQLKAVDSRLAVLVGPTEASAKPRGRKPGRPKKSGISAAGRARSGARAALRAAPCRRRSRRPS